MNNDHKHIVIDCSNRFQQARDGSEVWSIACKALNDLGVANMGYAIIPSRREALDRGNTDAAFFVHNYSKDWVEALAQQPVLDFDLTTTRILYGYLETHWTDDYLFECADLSPIVIEHAKKQAMIERSLGMKFGVTLGIQHQSTGGPNSGVGLCFDNSIGKNLRVYWNDNKDPIRRISELMDMHICSKFPSFHVSLTAREKDCLSYLACGLRPQEIAFRLRLSPRTLEKHFASAIKKLNARTRDQALAKALSLKLIDP